MIKSTGGWTVTCADCLPGDSVTLSWTATDGQHGPMIFTEDEARAMAERLSHIYGTAWTARENDR